MALLIKSSEQVTADAYQRISGTKELLAARRS
jgi:hypothetical protein